MHGQAYVACIMHRYQMCVTAAETLEADLRYLSSDLLINKDQQRTEMSIDVNDV